MVNQSKPDYGVIITERMDRKGRLRFGWACDACKSAAGAWPLRVTAQESADRHAGYVDWHKQQAKKHAA